MKKIEFLAFLVLLAFSYGIVYNGLFVKADYFLPTYDNAMLHSGRARVVLETSHWAEMELVFGGITKSYHVPSYPVLVASTSLLTGLNWLWSVRLVALLFAFLLPTTFFFLAKKLSGGNWFAGCAAAFFAMNSSALMTWGERTSPISLGVILVPALLYFFLKREFLPLFLGCIVLALTHQPSLLTFVAITSLFFVFDSLRAFASSKDFVKKTLLSHSFKHALTDFFKEVDAFAFLAPFTAFAVYIVWHLRQTGLSCIDFNCLPQLSAHEYGSSVDLTQYFSAFTTFPALLGVLWIWFIDKNIGVREKTLLYAWLIACLLLIKNDLLGFAVFTERFVTFFDEAVAVFAGVFVGCAYYSLVGFVENFVEKKVVSP